MEIKVVYSDYSKEVKSASISLENDQFIDIGYVDVPVETGENIKKLEVKYIDESLSMEIPNQMTLDEVIKYISLLQRFAKQL